MVRVLQILKGGSVSGGVENFICQYYTNIDRGKIHFDFLFCTEDSMKNKWDEVSFAGSEHIALSLRSTDFLRLIKQGKRIMRKGKYDVVHINTGDITIQYPCLIAAKISGIGCRISQSHSTGGNRKVSLPKKFLMRFVQSRIRNLCTIKAACSMEAAKHVFGENAALTDVRIIPNAIDVEQYRYNPELRERVRAELGLGQNRVFIQVGNFYPVKNHVFTLEVFKEIIARHSSSRLLMVGDGGLRDEIETKIAELGLSDQVNLMGYRKDIPRLLQGADCLLLPSLWEGFPMAALEAQASGTRVVCSNRVPTEADLIGDCVFLPLEKRRWVEECLTCNIEKKDTYEQIKKAGFDIDDAAKRLESIYVQAKKRY